ncbi:MAG TPA: hypothetical protein VN441_14025 [Syntrophomonas sp.]|nr:hypothetical protein [Syntrophomonas sp.]
MLWSWLSLHCGIRCGPSSPYLLTILVLVLVTIRLRSEAGAPAALSVPYHREER